MDPRTCLCQQTVSTTVEGVVLAGIGLAQSIQPLSGNIHSIYLTAEFPT